MCGAYNPIKDLYKTQVFEMMKWINKHYDDIIPINIVTKAPTAELRENQKDSDSLPDYEILDRVLIELIENNKMPSEIVNFDGTIVEKVCKLLQGSEYKRSQACVGTKISKRSFEKSEWRFNI
jgi:NAD+ synthetase